MELVPRLIDVTVPSEPDGVVLLLHGGATRRGRPQVSPTQLSVLRMIPIAHRVARAGHGRLAVFRLLNSRRGWDTSHTPLEDLRWALGEIRERLGRPLPVCLLGHSLGGRAALLGAGEPDVVSVIALAPWVYPADVPDGLPSDRRILIVHGSDDRVASPDRSAALARALMRHADVAYVTVEGGKHAMLSRHECFEALAADFAAETLLGEAPAPRGHRSRTLERLAGGEAWVSV